MGTKIEYSINLLSTSIDSSNLSVGGVDVWEHCHNKELSNKHQEIGINKLQVPMDRRLDRNNLESIKNTMQMHEDIFKQQVRELHRVYSVQKRLMDELKQEVRQKRLLTPKNGLVISHHLHLTDQQQHQAMQSSYGPEFHTQMLRDELSLRERSGSCSGDNKDNNNKIPRGFDLEKPAAEEDILTRTRGFDEGEAGPSSRMPLQSCKMSTNDSDEENEVDLTLSIGGGHAKKNTDNNLPQLGISDTASGKNKELNSCVSVKSERLGECSDPTTPMSRSSVTFEQERKRSHWLSQGLKLK